MLIARNVEPGEGQGTRTDRNLPPVGGKSGYGKWLVTMESVTVDGATLTDCPGAGLCDKFWFNHSHFLCADGITTGLVLFSRPFTPTVVGAEITWT